MLGYFISQRGIEANPKKIRAIMAMEKPKNLKGVQQLAGRITVLSRFISRMGEKALPFYQLLRKADKFEWTPKADDAFEDLKRLLSTSPVLVTPKEREPLLLYIAATYQVVSTILVVERPEEGKTHGVQRPIYYLSKVLTPTKQRYPHYQKLAYGVFTTARRLSHYFQEHQVMVINEAPLNSILNNPEATGRVALWGIELSPLDIVYEKRLAIKSQVLPDFLVHWMELQLPDTPDMSQSWTMHFDGSTREAGAGVGVILTSPQGNKMKYVLRMKFRASNNEAEYEALIHGMRMAKIYGATRLVIYGDFIRVIQQTMNECDAHAANMIVYSTLFNALEGDFDGCELRHVGRESNEEADRLTTSAPHAHMCHQVCSSNKSVYPLSKGNSPRDHPKKQNTRGMRYPKDR